ncbi:MAG: DUF5686 and carboxypeptidase regulatory-like domain-containing protein [Ignavibacteriaceae bacterium]|nr:DUF5686 and carboxypeptidase regulatory-like domain-containing protein [Ignavibacteriaceae bacterium]
MKTFLLFVAPIILCFQINAAAQGFFVRGSIKDFGTFEPLVFANVRVAGTTMGTSANKNGEFELKLPAGEYTLIVSFIGYISDTVEVKLDKNLTEINFNLQQTKINLPEITVLPGVNPALEIIRKAVKRKNERNKLLKDYTFKAYTKGVVWSDGDVGAGSQSVSVGLGGGEDSAGLKINAIIENESEGYFLEPDNYKEIINARKQSANIPSAINIFTGGRIIQNFYDEEINFLGKELPGPIADDALDYYYYYLVKTLAIDNKIVYQIYLAPDYISNPGFMGDIFIVDSTFDLIKVDLHLNRAANIGGILDTLNIYQQFNDYNNVFMPADYRMYVHANLLGLAEIIFDLNTILYDYNINNGLSKNFFNEVVIKVLPDADEKDSIYWAQTQTIPGTIEESIAYARIDSVKKLPRNLWDDFSFLSTRINFSDNIATSAPLAMYHFNRVEGHSVDFGIFAYDLFNQRFNSSIMTNYGFADKIFKADYNGRFLLGDYRTTRLEVNAYKKLNILFDESKSYGELFSSMLSLLSKYEFSDYYYSTGFDVNLSADVSPVIKLNGGFINRTDRSAVKNTDFSFFKKDEKFRSNLPVTETTVRAITAGFAIDFRKFIEDGYFRRRLALSNSYILLNGKVTFADKSLLKNQNDFTTYEGTVRGRINSIGSTSLNFNIHGIYNNGSLPFQMQYAIPGNIDLTGQRNTFRTLGLNEVIGDRVITVNLDHSWGDNIFRWLKIPVLKDLELQLNTYLNAAYSDISFKSEMLMPMKTATFKNPFFEAGFSLGHILFPMTFEFSWKLNHFDKNNFRFGINSQLMF